VTSGRSSASSSPDRESSGSPGLAEVARSTKGAPGLRFLDADASAGRQIEDVIATRMRGKLLGSSASAIPGLYLG
jgi:hypothetical protein